MKSAMSPTFLFGQRTSAQDRCFRNTPFLFSVILMLLLAPAVIGCRKEPLAKGPTGKMKIFVSVLPQTYFVERIGGDLVEVEALVGPGQSPHTFEVTPKQMAGLSEARVYFRIGIPFEQQIVQKLASLGRNLEIVDVSEGIARQPPEKSEDRHDEPENARHEEGGDPHTWLSPRLAKVEAKAIGDTLCRMDSVHAETYRENLKALSDDLDVLDAKLRESLAPLKGREVFVFHAAFGYFVDTYGLKQVAVETGGKEPGAKQLADLIEHARVQQVKVIFVQPQFPKAGAEAVARAIGGVVVPLDGLSPDYLNNLNDFAEKIHAALDAEQNNRSLTGKAK